MASQREAVMGVGSKGWVRCVLGSVPGPGDGKGVVWAPRAPAARPKSAVPRSGRRGRGFSRGDAPTTPRSFGRGGAGVPGSGATPIPFKLGLVLITIP